MTNQDDTPTGGSPSPDDCGCHPAPDGCDTGLIDDLTCRASGVAAQAAYDATYQEALDTAKADYDTTRKAYRAARQEAAPVAQSLKHELKQLAEKVRCLIKQRRVWKCLDDAFCEVDKQLKCCGGDEGCCVGECDFTLDGADELPLPELLAKIATYQQWTDEAKACFTTLTGEPAALTARVAAVQAQVDAINEALKADPAVTDLKEVYAQVLVAGRDLQRLWGGFDQTQDFVDCLCRALTCWAEGCAAVSALTGIKAVKECKQQAAEARCTRLRTETVEEILTVYERLCGAEDCPPPEDECTDDDDDDHDHDDHDHDDHDHDDDDDHDCGCGHHNHHHRQSGCDCGCHDVKPEGA